MKRLNLKSVLVFSVFILAMISCRKETVKQESPVQNEDAALQAGAQKAINDKKETAASFLKEFEALDQSGTLKTGTSKTIVDIAIKYPFFSTLVAAVVKTDLAGVLSDPSLNATVFAPTDKAFAKLPPPFNSAKNINAITNPNDIAALKSVLLYHVLGNEVKARDIKKGRSSAETLKPKGSSNDNTIYLSKDFGLIFINGGSLVLVADVDASNGVIHVVDDVLVFPTKNIAHIAVDGGFSTLVAALVKTDLVNVFTGEGDFTVFAPTNAAFGKLPAPFNSAENISNIHDPAQISALSNILRYHVTSSRSFTWDLGFFNRIPTLADGPKNKVIGILGADAGAVKGNNNRSFSVINPANILATNGVVHVINQVLLP